MQDNNPNDYLVSNHEEIPKEVQISFGNYKAKEEEVKPINDLESDLLEPIGKQEMNTILSNLTSYWIEIMASLGLFLYLYIYEIIGIFLLISIIGLFKLGSIELIGETISLITEDIGMKWFVLVAVFSHLSIGFFCLTTFSDIFQESHNIKKFFIFSLIKVLLYYIFSIAILKGIVSEYMGNFIKEKIEEGSKEFEEGDKTKLFDMYDKFMKYVLVLVGNFLATYNVFLDKLTLGSLYIFLFKTPNNIRGCQKVLFRSLSIIPIVYIFASLVLRAMNTINYINLSELVSPLLLGSKITIYGFFITTLCTIKYKSFTFNVYDSENTISPKVFKKVASKMFSIFGFAELIAGFIFTSWSDYGIGGKYLLILCAPIITLYDYKKKSDVKCFCCKKKDISTSFKVIFNIVGYVIMIGLGLALLFLLQGFVNDYISPILDLIKENLDVFLKIIATIT